jgi:formate dehydrogenase subunit gamma
VIPRFDRVERAAHWTTAALFGVLMLTGAVLYAGPFSAMFGRRELFRQVHVYAGILLPVPILLGAVGRWGAQLRRDAGRINRWTRDDARWFRRRNRVRPGRVEVGKFNAGQKLNAALSTGGIIVLLATGIVMYYPDLVRLSWRTGASFVHDWFALAIGLLVSGHISYAMRDPESRRGMRTGRVSPGWARDHHRRWADEEAAARASSAPVPTREEAGA